MRRRFTNISRYLVQRIFPAIGIAICFTVINIAVIVTYEKCPVPRDSTGMRARILHVAKTEELETKHFNSIFGDLLPEMEYKQRLVLFECDKKCRAENRFYNGILSAFLFSILSDRRLVISTASVCSAFSHFNNRSIRWKSDSLQQYSGQKLAHLYIPDETEAKPYLSRDYYRTVLHDFELKEWRRISPEVFVVSGDLDLVNDILRHKHSFHMLPESLRVLDAAALTRTVFSGLFETPRSIKDAVHDQLLEQVKETEELVCFHSSERFIHTDVIVMLLLREYGEGYKFFFSDDGINDNAFSYDDEAVIKLDFGKVAERSSCRNGFDSVVKAYILKLCHVLITTSDPLGVAAAQMRGNSKGLYCCDDFGVIYPCKWRLIADSFRDDTKLSVRYKSWHEELREKLLIF